MSNKIDPSHRPDYLEQIENICAEISNMNATFFILEKIKTFPTELFLDKTHTVFFNLLKYSFFDSLLLSFTKLLTDEGDNLITLNNLKSKIYQKYISDRI